LNVVSSDELTSFTKAESNPSWRKLLITLVVHEGWEVYVEQSTGFIVAVKEHKVFKLRKALYMLHQALRAWNVKLDDMLLSLGFRRTPSEHAIYIRRNGNAQLVVRVYVNDLVITGSDCNDIKPFKEEMVVTFKMSNLSLLHYYLGIEVKQSVSGISLSQDAYAMKLLERCGLARCNPYQTPMEAHLKLSKQSPQSLVDATAYRSIVGSLRYLVNTCPDLAFAIRYVSHLLEESQEDHLTAVK
jgi:hypothetical protein